ncbi:glycerol dehydratase reactivase beta/small subunit family protein [Prauserella halophila]|uniref:Glycerol dehydratase reactivase beta/small subunit family protein n=1 Tax=Prauserella halophila TaxID=185641 RepID=A0ABP4H9H9_9PSEU|nr:glycerol dehydratase reactivase beta/small subunit family protein [Prauserella halophila]MCP2237758.1 Dehydratase medium subunit [Prauserella halophila]
MSGIVDRRVELDRRSPPTVVVRCAGERGVRELLAGIEEEGVPVRLAGADGRDLEARGDGESGTAAGVNTTAVELAHAAARASPLDVGVGVDAEGRVCVHHAKRPADRPVVTADSTRARWCGHNAARLVVGLPLKEPPDEMEETWSHH